MSEILDAAEPPVAFDRELREPKSDHVDMQGTG